MWRYLVSLLLVQVLASPGSARDLPELQTVYWQGVPGGRVIGESLHAVDRVSGKICERALKTYRYGPCVHRVLQPVSVAQGNIPVRTYLYEVKEVVVPAGYKVLLEPALVNHHNRVWLLPYLYLDYPPFNTASLCAAVIKQARIFKPAPLLPISTAGNYRY